MGILADIEETKQLWKDSSLTFKVILVISTFLATGSIASISDVIFEWKGFILDAITFFRDWIGHPIRKYLGKFDLWYTQGAIDLLTLMLVMFTGLGRWIMYSSQRRRGSRVAAAIFSILLLLPCFLFSSYAWEGSTQPPTGLRMAGLIFLYSAAPFLMKIKYKAMYFLPVLVAGSITLLAGAINSGLTQ